MNARVILSICATFVLVTFAPVAAASALCAGVVAMVLYGGIALLLVIADECPVTWHRRK